MNMMVRAFDRRPGDDALRQRIASFNRRDDVATLIPAGGIGVELGVAAGEFSERIFQRSEIGYLFSVDMWAGDRGHGVGQYMEAVARLNAYRDRNTILRMRFDEAINLFGDESLDFIYVDGYAHDGELGGATFRDWYPKLRPGGIIAGDDYHQDWPLVVQAVNGFAQQNGLELHVINCSEDSWNSRYPTWFAFKPGTSPAPVVARPAAAPAPDAVPEQSLAAIAGNALSVYNGGLAASVGEVVTGIASTLAYADYADLAIKARRLDPAAVDAEILRSGYAAAMDPARKVRNTTAEAYQNLHDNTQDYQENNWLVDHRDAISSVRPGTVVEIGCGNGRFLRAIAPSVARVIGCDWARSPQLGVLPANVEFRPTNVLTDALPQGDVCCSADVLEHFEPAALPGVLRKLHEAAPANYHVIACYDDNHSHCSILHPGQWLALFKTLSPDYRLIATLGRPGRPDRRVAVITNIAEAARFFPKLGSASGAWSAEGGQIVTFRNDFAVHMQGQAIATWFPMANGTAAIMWKDHQLPATASLDRTGTVLTIHGPQGDTLQLKRLPEA